MQKGRKKGMTDKEIQDRKKKIVASHPRLSMNAIAKKYGVSYSYVCTLINKQKTDSPEIPRSPVSAAPKKTEAELMAAATKQAALPPASKELPKLEPPALVGKMLIQIGDKMYEIGSVSLFKA